MTTDLVAIGAGPANLSLRALADPVDDLSVEVLEARSDVQWHPGLLWSDSRLQVSGVKDLVSLVDPRSRFSFLNFLHEQGRLYRHLIASSDFVARKEFDQYFRWAAGLLDVRLDEEVVDVDHDGRCFLIHTRKHRWFAKNLVIGVGQQPHMPACARSVRSPNMWHASAHLNETARIAGKHILLVGGGQSAGEIALDLLSGRRGAPQRLTWITGRNGLGPLDDSPFSSEWFNPRFVEYFRELPENQRQIIGLQQRAAVNGITGPLLRQLYRRLYELDYLDSLQIDHQILAGFELEKIVESGDGFNTVLHDTITGKRCRMACDVAILATGYRAGLPNFMTGLRSRLPTLDGTYQVESDYRIAWDGPEINRIFVQNGSRHIHGVADPNLSLAAWRSGVIINSLVGREVYPLKGDDITLSLQPPSG